MSDNITDFPVKPKRTRRKTNYKGAANKKTSGFTNVKNVFNES